MVALLLHRMRGTRSMIKSYSELIRIPTFSERLKYLQCFGTVGGRTFGSKRYLNQRFYQTSKEWKRVRDKVILRDNACDLADPDRPIEFPNIIIIHHINPIVIDDIINASEALFDLENLICCSYDTHLAIHYGTETQPSMTVIERHPNDTCPWKK